MNSADLASMSALRAEWLPSFMMSIPRPVLGNNCVKQLFGNRMRFFTESIHS
jgi:hypothetical protein